MPKRKTTGNPMVTGKTATNNTMPIHSGNSNRGSGGENGAGSTFRKHASSSTLGSRADTKLSQASLSTFFAKVHPQNRPSKESPAARASSSHPGKPLAASAPIRTVGAKAPRRIIIDDEYDENTNNLEQQKVRGHSSYPMKRAKAENMARVDSGTAPRSASASLAMAETRLPFEERMPVSPVLSTARIEMVDRPSDIPDSEPEITTLSYTATTPQKGICSPNSTIQPSEDRSSPFRTPTGKSRRSMSTIESLGLSPQDSVFWVRTPPSEALKKLERMNSGRSHEEVQHGKAEDLDLNLGQVLLERKQSNAACIPLGAEPGIHLQRPTALDSAPRTPQRNQSPQTRASPGEFDQFFTDLEMDDHDLEELTQLELLSTPMNSASSNTTSTSSTMSSASSFAGSYGSKGVVIARLDTDAMIACSGEASQHVPRFGASFNAGTPTITQSMNDPLSDDFDDIGDLGDDFEIEDGAEGVAVSPPTSDDMSKYRRLRVTEVKDGVVDTRWRDQCKVLVAQETKDNTPFLIILRESWTSSRVTSGDIVHVIRAFIHQSGVAELILDNAQGYLIVRPDSLVPTSVLAESFSCIRKPIVDMRARKADESTVPLIHGTMLHELFQQSLRSNNFSTGFMESTIDAIIKAHLNDLCLVNESIETARESLSQLIPSCQDWASRYLRASPLCVNKILDIEENIWSPMFGLKGKIDATLQVVLGTSKKNAGSSPTDSRTLTVPFELKTGKKSNVISHRAQTMLYTLLMTDRYDVDVQWGLLFYLKTGDFIRVPAPHDEIRTILMQRNEIATYEEDKLSLPPMARSAQKCGRCFSFSSCTVLHRLLENGTPESSGLGNLFEEATDHLTDTHAEFLRKWNRLLSLEQGDVAKFQSQIWSMLSMDRQKAGNCFSNLLLAEELCDDTSDQITFGNRFMSHRYRFKIEASLAPQSQQTLSQTLRNGHSSLSSNISVGDPIVVSSERQHYALAIGHVLDMTLSDITVGLDRPLLGPPMRLDGYDMERNQSYRGLMEIAPPALSATTGTEDYHSHLLKNDVTFRIDKDEMAAGIARTRNNLIQLFRADANGGDAKRRHLVVDLERPTFEPVDNYKSSDPNLNDDQRQAVEAVLAAKDYALILGMPGTGKTTTIAHIIHTLVARGKSVLLSSYTHSAVDNVLLKLRSDINVVRLGNRDKIHRDIRKLVPDFTKPPVNTVEAIHNFYGRCQVVGTTCLGIGE
ncbi:DNA replication factor Dna2-domain-containing protein [Dissophora ornata]|nr:DNA replication factor Dna2-domain-containing protein [Dissophora ornata]